MIMMKKTANERVLLQKVNNKAHPETPTKGLTFFTVNAAIFLSKDNRKTPVPAVVESRA